MAAAPAHACSLSSHAQVRSRPLLSTGVAAWHARVRPAWLYATPVPALQPTAPPPPVVWRVPVQGSRPEIRQGAGQALPSSICWAPEVTIAAAAAAAGASGLTAVGPPPAAALPPAGHTPHGRVVSLPSIACRPGKDQGLNPAPCTSSVSQGGRGGRDRYSPVNSNCKHMEGVGGVGCGGGWGVGAGNLQGMTS